MIELVFLILSIFYATVIFFFYIGILREKRQSNASPEDQPFVSILVPARNEAHRIVPTLESLANQTYPSSNFEVIVIDDNSCDDTGKVVEQFIERRQQCNFKLLSHRNDGMKPTYKKTAISYAMQYARGEIILTTDADCLVQPKWVASMVSRFDEQTGLVAGLVTFYTRNGNRLFHQLQTLEFAGLVFAGVGAIGNHYPLICNASNLSYRRKAYDDVGGFDGHEEVPSGDDDLFMQNIHHHTNWRVRYNLNPEAVNSTHPVDTLAQFFNQRARWASKSTHYPGVATFTLLFLIYLFYLLLVVLTIAAIASQFSVSVLVIGLMLKLIPEFLVIRQALEILQKKDLLKLFWLAELFQIVYIVLVGFAGFFKLFKWKPNS